ncbi:MAG: DNA repair protein RecO [Melioribacteraceae bacterium]|nr:DNA repair protein RecO [Melioribacteraceae bacterium]
MSQIIKTKAIVLKKVDFSDSSRIATLFTEEFGKMSFIIKGARSAKSKIGMLIDTFNVLQIVFYKKPGRDVQIITQADLIKHHTKIMEDLEKLKYASAVIELLLKLTVEEEIHSKLFIGSEKILKLFNESNDMKFLFLKYLMFITKDIGYEINLESCSICETPFSKTKSMKYNHEIGMMCYSCGKDRVYTNEFSLELFNLLASLSSRNNESRGSDADINRLINFLERFLMYHIQEFNGIKSLHIF